MKKRFEISKVKELLNQLFRFKIPNVDVEVESGLTKVAVLGLIPSTGGLCGFGAVSGAILYGLMLFPMVSYLFSVVEHELLETTEAGR